MKTFFYALISSFVIFSSLVFAQQHPYDKAKESHDKAKSYFNRVCSSIETCAVNHHLTNATIQKIRSQKVAEQKGGVETEQNIAIRNAQVATKNYDRLSKELKDIKTSLSAISTKLPGMDEQTRTNLATKLSVALRTGGVIGISLHGSQFKIDRLDLTNLEVSLAGIAQALEKFKNSFLDCQHQVAQLSSHKQQLAAKKDHSFDYQITQMEDAYVNYAGSLSSCTEKLTNLNTAIGKKIDPKPAASAESATTGASR